MQSSFGAQSDFKALYYNNDQLCVIHFIFWLMSAYNLQLTNNVCISLLL